MFSADMPLTGMPKRRSSKTLICGPAGQNKPSPHSTIASPRSWRSAIATSVSFEFCDAVVNQLWGLLIEKQRSGAFTPPGLFMRVYEAFDAGEYHRTADASDDPIATFTDPQIAAIVRGL